MRVQGSGLLGGYNSQAGWCLTSAKVDNVGGRLLGWAAVAPLPMVSAGCWVLGMPACVSPKCQRPAPVAGWSPRHMCDSKQLEGWARPWLIMTAVLCQHADTHPPCNWTCAPGLSGRVHSVNWPLTCHAPPTPCAGHASQQSSELRAVCQSNLASCFLQLGQWQQCVDMCGTVLAADANNRKALYRRGGCCTTQVVTVLQMRLLYYTHIQVLHQEAADIRGGQRSSIGRRAGGAHATSGRSQKRQLWGGVQRRWEPACAESSLVQGPGGARGARRWDHLLVGPTVPPPLAPCCPTPCRPGTVLAGAVRCRCGGPAAGCEAVP